MNLEKRISVKRYLNLLTGTNESDTGGGKGEKLTTNCTKRTIRSGIVVSFLQSHEIVFFPFIILSITFSGFISGCKVVLTLTLMRKGQFQVCCVVFHF